MTRVLLAGKQTRADGSVYEGEFKDDKYNGRGEERGGRDRDQQGEARRGVGPGRPGSADGWQGCKGSPLRETER